MSDFETNTKAFYCWLYAVNPANFAASGLLIFDSLTRD